jgi:hypothetical protein
MLTKNLAKIPIDTSPSNKVKAMSSTSASALDGGHMTKADRRIITDKLDDVHDGDRYVADWSDQNVAKDLGVPRNWVSQIRDEYFGPDINEQTSVLADAAKLLTEIKAEHAAIVEKNEALLAQAMQLEGSIEKLKLTKHG